MIKRHKIAVGSLLVLGLLTIQLLATTTLGAAYERPAPHFKLTLLVPTNNVQRVLAAQVITQELWKIGIDAELVLMGFDATLVRLMRNRNFATFEAGGFDIGFIGWTAGFSNTALARFYHSRAIDKVVGTDNWYPLNNSRLDAILDQLAVERDREMLRQYNLQALNTIVWETHPVLALYQPGSVIASDAALRRTAYLWAGMHFEDDKQSEFIRTAIQRFSSLNPALTNSGLDEVFFFPVWSRLYQRDVNERLTPVLAAADPIPIGSNDSIAELVDPVTISADSSYKTQTHWGPNPNIDALHYNTTVVATNHSMFLIRLREGLPWQPGYGYTTAMKLNITVDDLLWTCSYIQNEELPRSARFAPQIPFYGSDYTRAFEKINETLFKVNFRGPTGNGVVADPLSGLPSYILPRHVLDPTFDATPYGGDVGITPDGTKILPYTEQERYRYNTGEGDKPLVSTGPYYFERWDEGTQMAIYRKFTDWGGYGANSLWNDPRFQQNNIDTAGILVEPSKDQGIIKLEHEEIDYLEGGGLVAGGSLAGDVQYLRTKSNIQVEVEISGAFQTMGYNTMHPKLTDRYVRLAISHLVPLNRIVTYLLSGLGAVNEAFAMPINNYNYPSPAEWKTLGLPESENVEDPDSGKMLEFQGHIRYNVPKAQALMEKAGYNMVPFREAVAREEAGERADPSLEPLPLLLASGVSLAIVGVVLVLSRRYWQQYQLARDPASLRHIRQRRKMMKAIKLKKSPRMTEKAQAQELFQQLATDKTLTPELTIYAMLNLCDMMLDEVRAYGDQAVFHEAEKLTAQLSAIAQKRGSGSVLVENLLLQSKFALLKGNVTQADQLLDQASTVAHQKYLPKLAEKVSNEQSALAKEVSRWEALTTQAMPLRDRLEQTRLQDYIASAVRIIELEEGLS